MPLPELFRNCPDLFHVTTGFCYAADVTGVIRALGIPREASVWGQFLFNRYPDQIRRIIPEEAAERLARLMPHLRWERRVGQPDGPRPITVTATPISLITLNETLYTHRGGEFPPFIDCLNGIERINLRREFIGTELPPVITRVKRLRVLRIRETQITRIPETIRNLTNLETLTIKENPGIESLPDLTALPNLWEFTCVNTDSRGGLVELPRLPETMCAIYLYGRALQRIPAEQRFPNIKFFACRGTQISEFPHGLLAATGMQSLTISGCDLTELPAELGQLVNLKSVDLSRNKITALPESIGSLRRLRTLICSHNKLTALPDSVCNLNSLRMFDCSYNYINSLPENFGNIFQLEMFNCRSNRISEMPESISNLFFLTKLIIDPRTQILNEEHLGPFASVNRTGRFRSIHSHP